MDNIQHHLDIQKVHDAFSPATEIHDPEMFVGRKNEISTAIHSLSNKGGVLVIYGLRGVGKSSIAHQIEAIAKGSKTLPKALGIGPLLPRRSFDYIVIYTKCDSYVKNIKDLIGRLLFGDESNPSLFSLTYANDKYLKEFKKTVNVEGGGNFFGVKLGAGAKEEKKFDTFVSDDLIQQFRKLLGTVRKDTARAKSGLLFLIDEFDIVEDKTGFASLVKACSSDFIKFAIVGIGSDISELISEHSSVGRQLDIIRVPHMSQQELIGIIRRAEFRVNREIIFDEDASNEITSIAEGFPFFTHLLGKEAMLLAYQRNSAKVSMTDIKQLSMDIAEGRLSTIFENLYHHAVKGSESREFLLKTFSEVDDDEMFIDSVFALAKEVGISQPAKLLKHLIAPDDGNPVLLRVRDECFRFADPVFKIYTKLRNWRY